jgi:hypothetical protein
MERRRKHKETETKAMLRFLPSKSTRNTTANPLRCFSNFTYHTLCSLSLCLSLTEIWTNGKINNAGTQKRNKGAKETEKKRKKVKQNAGCSHSERRSTQQKKARLISPPSSAGKQA